MASRRWTVVRMLGWPGGAMKTIAVVDDEPTLGTILREVLEDEGYRVLLATDGESGLEMVREQRPDLVLSDVMLPALDGMELAKRVHDDPRLTDIPVVLMSAGRRPGPEMESVSRAFIPKPFSIDTVIDVVGEQLSN